MSTEYKCNARSSLTLCNFASSLMKDASTTCRAERRSQLPPGAGASILPSLLTQGLQPWDALPSLCLLGDPEDLVEVKAVGGYKPLMVLILFLEDSYVFPCR